MKLCIYLSTRKGNKVMAENKVPREGGVWGVVVIFSAFFIQVIAFGTSQSIGVYNIEFLRTFDAGAAAVSLVGSINLGMLLGAGPICSALMSKWSHRQVALLGAVLSNIGLVFMPLAPNLPFMYAFYGFLTGTGYSMVYVPSHILSGLYYSKHRSLSTGVATSGSGLGSTIFPIIIYKLIQSYGWRGSLLLLAGFNLHLFIFAALLRPVPKALLKAYSIREKGTLESESLIKNNPLIEESNHVIESIHVNDSNQNSKVIDNSSNGSSIECSDNSEHDKLKDSFIDNGPNVTGATNVTNTSMLNHSNELSSNQSGTKLSLIQRVFLHFKTVFTFEFIIYCLSNIGWNAGGGILLIFLPKYMTTIGLTEENASLAFSLLGAGSCIGCVIGGVLGNIKCCDRILLYIAGNTGVGLTTFLFAWPYFHSFVAQLFLVFIFGFMFGIILGLLVVVTSDLLGTEALGYGFGYLMLANGVGIFSGPPIAGVVIDNLGRQEPAIYISGVFTLFGGIIMCVVPFRRTFCHQDSSSRGKTTSITVEMENK